MIRKSLAGLVVVAILGGPATVVTNSALGSFAVDTASPAPGAELEAMKQRPKPRVLCMKLGTDYDAAYVEPRACTFYVDRRRERAACCFTVINMHWRRWGRPKAIAKATVAGNMDQRMPGRLVLSNLSPCTAYGYPVFGRFHFQPRDGGSPVEFGLPGCANK